MSDGLHRRQLGFRKMSILPQEKGSPQPLIHQLNLKRIRSLSCGSELEISLKVCAFLSLQIVHRMIKKACYPNFFKENSIVRKMPLFKSLSNRQRERPIKGSIIATTTPIIFVGGHVGGRDVHDFPDEFCKKCILSLRWERCRDGPIYPWCLASPGARIK